ncbi:MAG: DUF5696 domain-containing protein [Anaeroplasma bactoclasticum]|nr:DUF5696 domain-containing protein [Anaeroplasma bactoclasticum]
MQENYFTLPFYKKWWIKIKQYIKNKKESFKFPFVKLGILLFILLLLGTIIIIVVTGKKAFPTHTPYDKTGFIAYDDLEMSQDVLENDQYEFIIDYTTTHFILKDKINQQVYESKPESLNKADTLTLYYSGSLGSPTKYGNYNYAINYEKMHRYAIRKTENSIEVLYYLGGKIKTDYTDFPQVISQERFEQLIQSKSQAYVDELKASNDPQYTTYRMYLSYLKNYKLNTEHGYYALSNPSALNELSITGLYELFYNVCGYTKEDLAFDHAEHGVVVEKTYPTFEVAIRYTLEEKGLQVELIRESIVDYEKYPLIYIDILPYFACATIEESGYSLIPDGSGAILDFNNNRSYASSYEQRIYGDDLAKMTNTMKPEKTKISFGVYGMKIDRNESSKGLIHIIEQGSECCSIVAQMNQSGNESGYNQTYYRCYLRETDTYRFESLSGLGDIQTWTNEMMNTSIVLHIWPLEDDTTYVGMAKAYQSYLIQEGLLTKQDQTSSVTLDLTLIGGYLATRNRLGITYHTVESLTTAQEVQMIAEQLKQDGIQDIHLIYQGFMNQGIHSTYNGRLKINSSIASKKQLLNLQETLRKEQISFYPMFQLATLYTDKYVQNQKLIANQYGQTVVHYQNKESMYLQDQTTTPQYVLKPTTYASSFEKIDSFLEKLKMKQIAFSDIGQLMYGSYQSKDMIFKTQTKAYFNEVMDRYQNEYQMLLTTPNDYALPYTHVALDVPTHATDYAIVLYDVPFYQLVVSGYIDYSSTSFNVDDAYSFDYHKMKAIETLSNIAMTWTYETTIDLVDTEYNYLYATYYQNWYQRTLDVYQELNRLDIYQARLVGHEYLNPDANIVKTTYSNGTQIVLNYSNTDFDYQGIIVPSGQYQVVRKGA